jgi:hypothetical protein
MDFSIDENMTIGEISDKMTELKQLLFNKISEVGKITVLQGMELDSILIPLIDVTSSGSGQKTYVIGVPQFESKIHFSGTLMGNTRTE